MQKETLRLRPITTKVESKDYLRILALAKRLGVSQTEVVRSGVLLYLEQNSQLVEKPPSKANLPSAAILNCGTRQ